MSKDQEQDFSGWENERLLQLKKHREHAITKELERGNKANKNVIDQARKTIEKIDEALRAAAQVLVEEGIVGVSEAGMTRVPVPASVGDAFGVEDVGMGIAGGENDVVPSSEWPAEYLSADEEFERARPFLEKISAEIHPWPQEEVEASNHGTNDDRLQAAYDPDNILVRSQNYFLEENLWSTSHANSGISIDHYSHEHPVGIVLFHPQSSIGMGTYEKWSLQVRNIPGKKDAVIAALQPDHRNQNPTAEWAAIEQVGMHIAIQQCTEFPDVLKRMTVTPITARALRSDMWWRVRQTIGQIGAVEILSDNRFSAELTSAIKSWNIGIGTELGELLLHNPDDFLRGCAGIQAAISREAPTSEKEIYGRLEFIVESISVFLAEKDLHSRQKNLKGMIDASLEMFATIGKEGKTTYDTLVALTKRFKEIATETSTSEVLERSKKSDFPPETLEELNLHEYAISCYAQVLGELQYIGLGDRNIADVSEEKFHELAKELIESKIRPAVWICESLDLIEKKRQEVIASDPASLRTKGVPLPWELPENSSRSKWREATQEWTRTVMQPITHLIDDVITDLMGRVFTEGRLKLLSPSQIQELFMTTGLFLHKLASTTFQMYEEAEMLPHAATQENNEQESVTAIGILRSFLVALARESGAISPVVYQALEDYEEQARPRAYAIKHSVPCATPLCDVELASENLNSGLFEIPSLQDLATLFRSEFGERRGLVNGVCSKILRHTQSVMAYRTMMKLGQSILFSVSPYTDQVLISCDDVKNVKGSHRSARIPRTPYAPERNMTFTVNKPFRASNAGLSGTFPVLLPPSHNIEAQRSMRMILDTLPMLHWRLRKLIYLHCPDLLREEEPPEPLVFLEDETGVIILCKNDDLGRVQAITGCQPLSHNELSASVLWKTHRVIDAYEYSGVRLPSAAGKQKEFLNIKGVQGELISGQTESDQEVEEDESGSRGASDREPLPKLPIIIGMVLKHQLHATVSVDSTEIDCSGGEDESLKDILPSDCGENGYVILTLPELHLQILASNQSGRAVYVVPDCKDPETYVGVSPKELRDEHDAQKITWNSERQFMDAIENVLLERLGGAAFLPARKLLRDFPDEKSNKSVRADTGKVAEMHNEHSRRKIEPWEVSVGNFQKVRAGQTWAVGITGAGSTALDAYARGNDLRAPYVREQIVHLANERGIDSSSSTCMIRGFAGQLGLPQDEYEKFEDLRSVLAERYKLSQPTKRRLLRALADELCDREEVNRIQGVIETPQRIQVALRAAAHSTILYETYPEYRQAKERTAMLRYAREAGYTIYANNGVIDEENTIAKVRQLVREERE